MSGYYELRAEEVIAVAKNLRPAEFMVWAYVSILLASEDKPNLSASRVASDLGLPPATVSKAIKRLDRMGYIADEEHGEDFDALMAITLVDQ
jgi:DNA-binding MarR family transcriptional regulator